MYTEVPANLHFISGGLSQLNRFIPAPFLAAPARRFYFLIISTLKIHQIFDQKHLLPIPQDPTISDNWQRKPVAS
jgi:hypothetical protein